MVTQRVMKNMKLFIKNACRYSYFIFYSARADLRAEVANTYLNWFWWILEPFLDLCVYTFVFGTIFHASEPNFPIFIFSALIMWNYFSKTVNQSVKMIRSKKGIITRIYVPKYILLMENMALNFFKMLFSVGVLILMMVVCHVPVTVKICYLVPVFIVLFIFTFGISLIMMHLGVFIDDLAYAITILLKLVMYLSGVMYNIDKRLPEAMAHAIQLFNPMAMLISNMRRALLYDMAPDFALLAIWFAVSCAISGIGIAVVGRYENSYVKVI